MPEILDYHDYREYLKDVYEERKQRQSFYSYRVWAQRLQINSSQLFRILAKDIHLPLRFVPLLQKDLDLGVREEEYFAVLVALGRAKNQSEKHVLFERLLGLRDIERRTLNREHYLFFAEWHHTTLRCLLGAAPPVKAIEDLGSLLVPPITPEAAKESLELLLRLGMVEKKGKKGYHLSTPHLTTGQDHLSPAIRGHQQQMLALASEALGRFPKEERDFSTLTFAVDRTTAAEIGEILRECRREIQKRIAQSKAPDRVLHLNMSMFPTARWPEKTQ